MNVLVLRTNVDSPYKLWIVNWLLNKIPGITRWTVDQEDRDRVLRIETVESIDERTVSLLLNVYGLECEDLT